MYIYTYIYIYTRGLRAVRARIGPWALVGPSPGPLPWALVGPCGGPGL